MSIMYWPGDALGKALASIMLKSSNVVLSASAPRWLIWRDM